MLKKIAFSLSLLFALSACSSLEKEQEQPAKIGLANPAAVYCTEQGGTYHLENSDCTLKTGEVVNAWDFYRGSQK